MGAAAAAMAVFSLGKLAGSSAGISGMGGMLAVPSPLWAPQLTGLRRMDVLVLAVLAVPGRAMGEGVKKVWSMERRWSGVEGVVVEVAARACVLGSSSPAR